MSQSNEDSWLTHQWVVAGIVSASSRFIPVPFVDDLVRDRCRRFAVSRTLAAHGREELLEGVTPYFDSDGGVFKGCLGSVARLPLKLLLFPIRKIVALATSIRGVPLEVMRTVLLGRTLDRYLRSGKFNESHTAEMRTAFEQSFQRMDFHVIRAAIADAMSGISGWKSSATQSAKEVAAKPERTEKAMNAEPAVQRSADKVQEVLDRPDTLELFAEFDTRFDARFAELIEDALAS